MIGAAYCVTILALLADWSLGALQYVLSPRGLRRRRVYEPDLTTAPAVA